MNLKPLSFKISYVCSVTCAEKRKAKEYWLKLMFFEHGGFKILQLCSRDMSYRVVIV